MAICPKLEGGNSISGKDKIELIQIYKKNLPSKWIKSMYGKITYWDFLCKEKDRLESLGRRVAIEGGYLINNSKHAECCMLVNKIA